MSTFYSVQRRNSGTKDANFFAGEEDSMMSVDSNFNFLCGRPHGAGPPFPRPPEPDPSPPPCGRHKWMAPKHREQVKTTPACSHGSTELCCLWSNTMELAAGRT